MLNVEREVCSCGHPISTCVFWGPVLKRLLKRRNATLLDRYRIVFQEFANIFGKAHIIVDSSKHLRALRTVSELDGIDVRVIHLLKDVRNWTHSMKASARRNNTSTSRRPFRARDRRLLDSYVTRTAPACFLSWYATNRKFQQFIQKRQLPSFQVGYEEFSLYRNEVMEKLCGFLRIGHPIEDSMSGIRGSNSHNILGNRMRHQEEKTSAIRYDDRWFRENGWILTGILCWPVLRYNASEVYKNTTRTLWST